MLTFKAESYSGRADWIEYEIYDGAEKIAHGIQHINNAFLFWDNLRKENAIHKARKGE